MIVEALKARLLRGLIAGVSLAVCGYFALWACAPVATVHAPVAMPASDSYRVSGGLMVDGVTPLVSTPKSDCSPTNLNGTCLQGVSVEGYAAYRYRRLELSLLGFAGTSNYFGGGVGVRGYILDRERLQLGLDAHVGWFWVDAGVPLGLQVAEGLWLYTRPNVNVGVLSRAVLPVGAALELGDHVLITPEVGLFGTFNGPNSVSVTGLPHLYGGVGLVFRIGGGDPRQGNPDSGATPPAASPTPPPAGPDAPPPLVSPRP